MERNSGADSIILRTQALGEIHSTVHLLCLGSGIIKAVAHGTRSAKGSLRGSCLPLNRGYALLYHEPVHDSWKLREFQSNETYQCIKDSLPAYLHACFWLDLFSRVPGDGNWEYHLLIDALDALSKQSLDKPSQSVLSLSTILVFRFLQNHGILAPSDRDARTSWLLPREAWTKLAANEGGFVLALEDSGNFSPLLRLCLHDSSHLGFSDAAESLALTGLSWHHLEALVEMIFANYKLYLPAWDFLRTASI